MIFKQMKLGISAIPQFYVILTLLSIFKIILIIQGYFDHSGSSSRPKDQFQGQEKGNIIFTKKS